MFLCLVEYPCVALAINSQRKFGDYSLIILKERKIFRHHRYCCRDSKPRSLQRYSLKLSLLTPVMASAAYTESIRAFHGKND